MASYWITFRIAYKDAGGLSYDERYESFTSAIVANSSNYWGETTSFYIFESSNSIDTLARIFKASCAPSKDLFLIRQIDSKTARICGENSDRDIYEFMPYLEDA